jgi:hypothetical protein
MLYLIEFAFVFKIYDILVIGREKNGRAAKNQSPPFHNLTTDPRNDKPKFIIMKRLYDPSVNKV